MTLAVERLDDGEVSPHLVGEVVIGDRLELRGPIGGYFVWEASQDGPPARSMTFIYREELEKLDTAGDGLSVHLTLTRQRPPGWRGCAQRIDRQMLQDIAWPSGETPRAFVSGPTAFVESAAEILVGIVSDARSIKTERFGPSGPRRNQPFRGERNGAIVRQEVVPSRTPKRASSAA